MGQATFLDIIKALRRLSFKEFVHSLEIYRWETGGFLIVSFFCSLFTNLFSTVYLYLLCSYFWGWTLASPALIRKTEGRKYRFSLLKIIVRFERKMRESFLEKSMRRSRFYRPFGRILSLFVLGVFVSLILKSFEVHIFIIGGIVFEFFRAIKYFEQGSV